MKIVVKTLHGLEDVLSEEIKELGGTNIQIRKRAIECEGSLEFLYSANLNLRTAISVLVPIYTFHAKNENELYNKIKAFDWSKYLNVRQTFSIDNTVFSEYIKNSKFASLRMKDAIVDQFRDKYQIRPSVDTENPDVKFDLHGYKDRFSVSLDSSGDTLNMRGYRGKGHKAPLNEVLAAGLLKLAKWQKSIPLIDPMCGTGTILIEAAMIATNMAPNLNRKNLGFINRQSFEPMIWNRVRIDAQSKVRKSTLEISGGDIDPGAIKMARKSFKELGIGREIRLRTGSFDSLVPTSSYGMIITNPPYGERIGDDVLTLYKEFGDKLKHSFTGFDAWILSSNKKAFKQLRLEPTEKIELFNGALDVEFCKYSLYEGSKDS